MKESQDTDLRQKRKARPGVRPFGREVESFLIRRYGAQFYSLSDKDVKTQLAMTVATSLQTLGYDHTADEIKNKFKNLRKTFMKNCNDLLSGVKESSKWVHFNDMQNTLGPSITEENSEALNLDIFQEPERQADAIEPQMAHSVNITSSANLPAQLSPFTASPFVGLPSANITTRPAVHQKSGIRVNFDALNKNIQDMVSIQQERLCFEKLKLELEHQKNEIDLKISYLNDQLCAKMFQTADCFVKLAGDPMEIIE